MAYRNQTPVGIGTWIKSIVFYVIYGLMGMIHGFLSVIIGPWLSFERRYHFINLWTRASLWLVQHLNGIEVELRGRENIPEDGRFVVMSNHQSQFETFFLQVLFAPQATILKRELLWVPFFGWALALLKPIKIDRSKAGSALKQIVEQGKDRLDNGVPVVIFPEGTRQSPGEMGEFSVGGAMLASKAGAPILPVAHNAGDCWPARSKLRVPGRIIISIGEPIATEGRKTREINDETADWIAGEFQKISAEVGFTKSPVEQSA
jgi:1-acyl-sn-glycerol-3-phosphate acyltransferase